MTTADDPPRSDEHPPPDPGRAVDAWMPLVYEQLRSLAAHYLAGERQGHTLQATALVHEAYARLANRASGWEDRAHFFRTAVTALRRILVEHARSRGKKRRLQLPADGVDVEALAADEPEDSVLAVDAALDRLAEINAQQARLVELRFFGGFRTDEIAEILDLSPRTVARDWALAKAWLTREIREGLGLDC